MSGGWFSAIAGLQKKQKKGVVEAAAIAEAVAEAEVRGGKFYKNESRDGEANSTSSSASSARIQPSHHKLLPAATTSSPSAFFIHRWPNPQSSILG